MYESYFGFQAKPFALLPDPGFLYLGKQHSSSLAMLEYGLANQAGFTVLTGEIGCGKTTLLHLLAGLDKPTSGTVGSYGTEVTALSGFAKAAWRPVRTTVRVERDPRDARVIHDYGQGGSGFTLAYGCALSVLELVGQA